MTRGSTTGLRREAAIHSITVEGRHMRPTSRRSERAAERSAEVLDAAARVLARLGYDATSIDDIADELDATKGRVYHYYRSKSDILLGVLKTGLQRLMDDVGPIAEDTSLSADERLYRMARAHAQAMMTHHPYQVVTIRSLEGHLSSRAGNQDAAWTEVIERRRDYEQLFVRVLEEGHSEGVFLTPDPRLTVRGLLGALNWITVWFDPTADPKGKATPDEIADHLARFVVTGARDGKQP
ncbi:TetR family transcriptional regulator [Streptomyces hygroscopicus]|uniref:TetR family transcriptional regulator n=1 Tax=Streptomyces hygroscopicus TaxID=1912 RepID=UPI00363571AA